MDSRLSTIVSNPETEFGGINVILCGDFYQLSPIASKPLYDDGQGYVNSPEVACGQHLYSLLDRTIVLDQIIPQEGADERSRLLRWQNCGITVRMASPIVLCSFSDLE